MAAPINQLENINDRNELVVLITAKDVKTFCNLYSNTENSQLNPSIFLVQEVYLKPTLGITLYNDLIEQWAIANYNPALLPDGTTLPDAINYKALYYELKHMLIWWAYYRFLPNIAIKVAEKGITLENSDFSENGGIVGLKELESRAKVNALHYQSTLVTYLETTFKSNIVIESEKKDLFKKSFMGIYYPSEFKNKCK